MQTLTSSTDAKTMTALCPVDREVTEVEREALLKIACYPFTQVRAKLAKSGQYAPSDVEKMIFEFRRWLALIALGNKKLPMISPEVDEVWHNFIVFTRDYMAFCVDVFGKYIHHQPVTIPNRWARNFQLLYADTYGAVPQIWSWNSDEDDEDPDDDDGEDYCYHNDPSDDDEA